MVFWLRQQCSQPNKSMYGNYGLGAWETGDIADSKVGFCCEDKKSKAFTLLLLNLMASYIGNTAACYYLEVIPL